MKNKTILLVPWEFTIDISQSKEFRSKEPTYLKVKSSYQSVCKKWTNWYNQRSLNPFCYLFRLSHILNYLTSIFVEGCTYYTTGVERVHNKLVGQHHLAISLLPEVFISRPPKPTYNFVWDIQVALDFFKKNWEYPVL